MPEGDIQAVRGKARAIKGIGFLASGTVFAQALMLLASPILTRLYTPDDFGVFGVYAGLSATLALIACGSYDVAIPYAKDDATAGALARLSFFLLPVTTLIIAVISLTQGEWIFSLFNISHGDAYAWAIPVTVLLLSGFQIGQNVTLRLQRYSTFAHTNVWQTAATAAGQLVLGFAAFPTGIITGYVFGRFVGAVSALSNIVSRAGLGQHPFATAKAAAAEYRKFPLYLTWSSLLNQVSTLLPVFLLSAFFAPEVAGLMALSQRVLQVPFLVVTGAVKSVFISLAQDAQRQGYLRQVTLIMVRTLMLIGLPSFALLALVTPELFELAFGSSWREAGVFAQYLVPWLAMAFMTSPLSAVLPTLQKQQFELLFQIALILSRGTALGIGILANDASLSVALFGLTTALCWVFFMFFSMSLAGNAPRKVALVFAKEILFALPFLLPVSVLRLAGLHASHSWTIVAVAALSGAVLAAVVSVRILRARQDARLLGLLE